MPPRPIMTTFALPGNSAMTRATPDSEFRRTIKRRWSDCRLFATLEKGRATLEPFDRPKLCNPWESVDFGRPGRGAKRAAPVAHSLEKRPPRCRIWDQF